MANAKVVLNGTTLIDLTQDTVTAESMLSGVTAHKNDGTTITGTIANSVATEGVTTITEVTDKNLLDDSKLMHGYYNPSNLAFVAHNSYISYHMELTSGTYTFSTDLTNCYIIRYWINNVETSVGITRSYVTFTANADFDFKISIRNTSTSDISSVTPKSQIESGSSATSYQPHGITGIATRGVWRETAGYTSATTISASSFKNTETSGHTYVDISFTEESPKLKSGDYLYIDKGYTDDLKISLSKLMPEATGTLTIVESGNTNCAGYEYVNVPSATPAFDGGVLTGASTAVGTNATLSSTNNGIKIQTKYSASSTDVLYNGAVNGWVDKENDSIALAGKTLSSTNGTAYYINGVKLEAPSSGTRQFSITVPNGSASNFITFTFTVDSSNNVTVTES